MSRTLALLASALVAGLTSCDEGVRRPNLLLVVIDTVRADHTSAHGYARPTTPCLDALADEGVRYQQAYAHSGWTLPSVASLFTGRLPHEHRVGRAPHHAEQFGRLPDEETTLAEHLSEAGYRCGAIVNNTFLAPEFGLNQGFGADYDYAGATNREIRSAEDSVDLALAWITAETSSPYFLVLHLMEPHLAYDPPAAVRGTFNGTGPSPVTLPFTDADTTRALRTGQSLLTEEELAWVTGLYDEEILAADRAVGRLARQLSGDVRWANTVLVVTSDHGEEFFEHGGFEHGHSLYGELTHVPLVARGPGVGTGVVDELVSHVDVFQSLLACAGIPQPTDTRGTSLFEGTGTGTDRVRRVVTESVLSGTPRASIRDEELSLHVGLETKSAEVWRLDEDGIERERMLEGLESEHGATLLEALRATRGDLSPVDAIAGPRIPHYEAFLQLKALGYVGDR